MPPMFRKSFISLRSSIALTDGRLCRFVAKRTNNGCCCCAAAASLLVACSAVGSAATVLALSVEAGEASDRKLAIRPITALCESSAPALTRAKTATQPHPPGPQLSCTRRVLNNYFGVPLPIPRQLSRNDPVFRYAALRAGLKQRARDEARLRSLQKDAIEARESGDVEKINAVFSAISSIAYGQGVSPQEREDFLVRYGCSAWTEEILTYLVELASDRGIVEIGAGNGQWARAIEDHYKKIRGERNEKFDIVVPFDDMSELPLSSNVYHRHTQPFRDYFHSNVRKASNTEAVRKWESRGRVALIVYPSPGEMAIDTVKAYIDIHDGNDTPYIPTVVYVGEGIGGANANNEFFYFFLKNGWYLVKEMNCKASPGGKGHERLFVLQKCNKYKTKFKNDYLNK